MQISASMVKELRERTGAGMMECKKALVASEGDIDAAIEAMRKSGQAKADKKAGRVAAEGLIAIAASNDNTHAVMVEVNCETDFVAKQDEFKDFVNALAQRVLAAQPYDVEQMMTLAMSDGDAATIEDRRRELVAKLGENISVRRFSVVRGNACVGAYLHGGRIGVLVGMESGGADIAKDVAMHVAASRPICVSDSDIPPATLASERSIFQAQAADSGKSEEIIAKMVDGRMRKYINEVTLLGQPFVKDPDQSVKKFLDGNSASVTSFERLEVGEGIEKKTENFAEEVMATAKGA
jgi:elongation factor Ts